MHNFETTTLWKSSLGRRSESGPEKASRESLRNGFMKFRARAQTLAGEIPGDQPGLTVHDITHLDALWEVASIIAGPGYALTPAEGFVLGGAFLVHDLAMSQAAYGADMHELQKRPEWLDTVTRLMRNSLGRMPSEDEIQNPPVDIKDKATSELFRLFHAKQAAGPII